MPIKTKKKMDKRKIIMIIVIVVFILVLSSICFAKYQKEIRGKGGGIIAKPIMEIHNEQSILITAEEPKSSCYFEVRNYNEQEQINETEMEYYIQIENSQQEAILYQLYRDGEQIPLEEGKTKRMELGIGEKQKHVYRLDITYEKENEMKQDIQQEVEVKIYSIQKTS